MGRVCVRNNSACCQGSEQKTNFDFQKNYLDFAVFCHGFHLLRDRSNDSVDVHQAVYFLLQRARGHSADMILNMLSHTDSDFVVKEFIYSRFKPVFH